MLRLMSNNIWWCDSNTPDWERMGEDCSAAVRSKGFARVYSELSPDVIGFQEASAIMLRELVISMQERGLRYAVLWGGDTPIMYKADKLELIDSDFAYYDEHIEGFEGCFNNDRTKSYTVAVFKNKENGKLFVFATTHLWWMSSNPQAHSYRPRSNEARAHQLGLLADVVARFTEKYSCPSVIVGDLNAGIGSMAIDTIYARGYRHAHDIATEYADNTNGYHGCGGGGYSGYEPQEFERGIDHILLKGEEEGAVKRFDRYYPEYYMSLSDHFPAFADVEF
jgi:endonuclease/exonuclease/phosphatase family metal-dependent hydrolase